MVGRRGAIVRRRPRIAILSTGDELVGPDRFEEVIAGRKIIDSNSPMLVAALLEAGCEPIPLGIAADDEESLLEHLQRALERSEEHTSELQSRGHLVCRLLLE